METEESYVAVMTIEEWKLHVKMGLLTPYDGSGSYGTKYEEFSDTSVWSDKAPKDATHVWWYNK